MLAEIEDLMFADPDPTKVATLITLVANSRHLLLVDVTGQNFRKWSQVAPILAAKVPALVNAGMMKINAGYGKSMICVHTGASDWNSTPPKLSFSDALVYLNTPFRIFVENNNADRAFLRAYMSDSDKKTFEENELKGWLQFIHGGGIDDLERQIVNEAEKLPGVPLRSFALFDNDGLFPNTPSSASTKLKLKCAHLKIPHYQLTRRAIENYIHNDALHIWSKKMSNRSGFRALTALKKLTNPERDHFNMKEGLAGDSKRTNAPNYPLLSKHDRRMLQKGFGTKLSSMFSHSEFAHKPSLPEFIRAANEVRTAVAMIWAIY